MRDPQIVGLPAVVLSAEVGGKASASLENVPQQAPQGVGEAIRSRQLHRLESSYRLVIDGRFERFPFLEVQEKGNGPAVVLERGGRQPPLVLQRVEVVAREAGVHRSACFYSRAVTPAAHSSPMRRR